MTAAMAGRASVGIVAAEQARLGVDKPAKPTAKKAPAKKAPAAKPTAKKAPAKKAPAKKRPAVSARQKATARKLAQPVATAGTGSFAGFAVATLSVVLLYRFLRNADQLAGFLGGLRRALEWLRSPTAIIEFGDNPS